MCADQRSECGKARSMLNPEDASFPGSAFNLPTTNGLSLFYCTQSLYGNVLVSPIRDEDIRLTLNADRTNREVAD